MRLQKYIADTGYTSRRKAEKLILEHQVTVNGTVITELGVQVDFEKDKIKINGKLIHPLQENRKKVFILYKPKNCICSLFDPEGRNIITNYFPNNVKGLYPIGRLDYDSEGLIFITNVKELNHKLAHPKKQIKKKYLVKIKGRITTEELDEIRKGPILKKVKLQRVFADIINQEGNKTWLDIGLLEGKNRQIRRMFDAIGYKVLKIQRYQIGNFNIENLSPGKYKEVPYQLLIDELGL